MLDNHQLNVFLEAAETLNFTKAARRLHMSQPSVSQHIQALEQQLGVSLFSRDGRRIALTDAGAALVPLARDAVHRSLRIMETMHSLSGRVYGHIKVGCSTTPGKYLLPRLLAAFHRRYPDVRLTCQVAAQHISLQALEAGDVHFALSSRPRNAYRHTLFRHFFQDDIVLIAPLDHRWAQRESVGLDELPEERFILRESSSGTQLVVSQTLGKHGMDIGRLDTVLTLGNSEAIALAVKEGLGVGFVSRIVATRLVQDAVAIIPIEGILLEREVQFGRYTGRPATIAQEAFWRFVETRPLLVE